MKPIARYAFNISVVAALTACGGQSPTRTQSLVPQTSAVQPHHFRSWMLAEAKRDDLLYVSDFYGVHVFSYPKLKPVGEIAAESAGMCSDRAGNVFFTVTAAYQVVEYAHGGTKPIRTFYDPTVEMDPYDCSVDPTTNNLAIAPSAPYVVVFPNEQNQPRAYSAPRAYALWCTYDDQGNLYIDQVFHPHHRRIEYIAVLKKGTTTFKNYRLGRGISAGGLQFDGRHVVVVDLSTNTLYRVRFSGSDATAIGSTPLGTVQHVRQFWISGRRVIAADLNGTAAYIWKYPEGRMPVDSIEAFYMPQGSTISVKQ